jgi:hypothetical protein
MDTEGGCASMQRRPVLFLRKGATAGGLQSRPEPFTQFRNLWPGKISFFCGKENP